MANSKDFCRELDQVSAMDLSFPFQPLAIDKRAIGAFQVANKQPLFGLQEFGVVTRNTVGRNRQGIVRLAADGEYRGVYREVPDRIAGGQLTADKPVADSWFAVLRDGMVQHGGITHWVWE